MCTSRLNGKIRSAQRWTYVLANSALLLESTGAAAHEIAAPRGFKALGPIGCESSVLCGDLGGT